MGNLVINAEAKVRSLNFHEHDNGDRNINARIDLFTAGDPEVKSSINVSCVQPNSDTKAAENYLEAYLKGTGLYTDAL